MDVNSLCFLLKYCQKTPKKHLLNFSHIMEEQSHTCTETSDTLFESWITK